MNSILEKIDNSIISEIVSMTKEKDILNLAESAFELLTPKKLKKNAIEAIEGDFNSYIHWGGRETLRINVAEKIKRETGLSYDPLSEVIITSGSIEGLVASMHSLVEGENGVVIPEPFYENYLPIIKLSRGKPIFLKLNELDFSFHFTDLQKLPPFKVFILNNPHNPTGKLFNEEEINAIGDAIIEKDAYLIVDESYRDIVYDNEYVSPLANKELVDRTIIIGSFSTVLSIGGWRIGFVAAREPIMKEITKVHYYYSISAPAPFQWACENFEISQGYINGLQDIYKEKREILSKSLKKAGFKYKEPQGGYYILADFEKIWDGTDWGFTKYLMKNKNIAVIPGTAFYFNKERGKRKVRFTFSQSNTILKEAGSILASGIT